LGQSFDFSLQVRVRDQGRAQSRAHIAPAGRNGFLDLRFDQGCGLGLGFFRTLRSRLDTPGTHQNKMRTFSQWAVES
jgi:hypothetical protein